MARLIDADILIKEIYENTKIGHYGEFMDGSEVAYTYNEIVNCIDSVPLAYDVEKVAAELEEAKGQISLYGDDLDFYCSGLDEAIDIVKRGGA